MRPNAPVRRSAPGLSRRSLLLAWGGAPWALRAAEPAPSPAPVPDPRDVIEPIEVEAGVYMLQGARGEPSAANLGRVGNAGFIVGRNGVLVIDTGTSWLHGEALLRAVASVTPQPVRVALVTHVRQEFLFGAAALQARGIPVHMQQQAAALMAARCESCLKTLQRDLGAEIMQGTRMFKPDATFDETYAMDMIGRPVLVQSHGHASGPGDSTVFDVRTGTLFAGGLLDQDRIPDVQDSDLEGWKSALGGLRTLRVNTVVPGHGPMTSSAVIGAVGRYLVQLEQRCAELLQGGAALSEVADAAQLPEFRRWDQYDTIHRRNASIVFLRQERASMFSPNDRGSPKP